MASPYLSRKTFSFGEFENFSPENKGLYLQHDNLIFQTKMFQTQKHNSGPDLQGGLVMPCLLIHVPCTETQFNTRILHGHVPSHSAMTEEYARISFSKERDLSCLLPSEICFLQVCDFFEPSPLYYISSAVGRPCGSQH